LGGIKKLVHHVTDNSGPAASADLERLTRVLLQSLEASGYIKQGAKSTTEENVRRLIHRFTVRSDDAELLLGMLRKVLWKLEQHR
jgi:tRNA C32,U32 (ribose-2'-O)-methylase TrmJ